MCNLHSAGSCSTTEELFSGTEWKVCRINAYMIYVYLQSAEVYQPAAMLQCAPTRWLVGDSNKLDRSSEVNLDPG